MKTNEALRDDIDPGIDPVLDYEVISVPSTGNDEKIAELVVQRAPQAEIRTSYAAARAPSVAKRIFDIVGAIAIGLLLAPLFLVISAAIRITGSPVIFSHRRVGWNHQPFRCYKFRSMVPDAERVLDDLLRSDSKVLQEWRTNHKLLDDPRVTRLGAFLRKTSLDELPQLWNVIKGDMSLVGPRPIVADEMERYGDKAHAYCSVRPGMTGLWQISGRSNVTYSRRVSLDMLYIRRQNLGVDLWILWRTAFVVLSRFGAY